MIIEYRIFIFIVDKSLKLTAFMIAAYSPHGKRGLLRMQTDSLGRTFYRKRVAIHLFEDCNPLYLIIYKS